MNHTSDQHPWFQRARRARPGSRWRNFYVWSDTPNKYQDTRIIFKDVETSNWTWDRVAKAYFWHRFFSHQPDLNYDNPEVHEAMFKVVDFWLDLGVDGLRLDAVPYLYEREGTNCENLPETHAFLKKLRAHVDEKYGDRMLLAEANQWPEDAVTYFGQGRGDECHMAFHFPLMPRLFMALRMEDRLPIVDILEQTPPIPETSQWALFLRNHDELTLEMVTDEERDYMYRMYAHVHQARLNLGIRRRLAPLLNNDRKSIELLNALLFSLPGTPVLYYGDEIGWAKTFISATATACARRCNGVADKNAGFSAPIRKAFTCRSSSTRVTITKPSTWRCNWTIRIHCSGGCAGCSRCGNAGARWARANANFSIRTIARCSPTCCATNRKRCWWWPTCRVSCSRSNWICPRSNRACRSNCLAARNFRSSPGSLISSRLARTPFSGFRWKTNPFRPPSSRLPACGRSFPGLRFMGNGIGFLMERTRPGWKPSCRPT